jgi:hypothetical protein
LLTHAQADRSALALLAIALAGFWRLTTPRVIAATELPSRTPDLANGERMFWAGGCESCHTAANAQGEERLKLRGGLVLATPTANSTC